MFRKFITALAAVALVSCAGGTTGDGTAGGISVESGAAAGPIRCPTGQVRKGNRCIPTKPTPPPPPPTQTCANGSVILTTQTCPPPPPAPPPTQTCADGSVVSIDVSCPTSPPPPPPVQCPDGTAVPAGSTCPVPAPPPETHCPDGTMVPAGQTCPVPPPPPPPPVTCADGSTLPAGSICPVPVPVTPAPLTVGGAAKADTACQSLANPNDTLQVGAIYTVQGFAAMRPIGQSEPFPTAAESNVVILTINDGLHRGDGWFAFWVPMNCVEGVAKAG